ncbi:sigma-70 family RNA polymerase sigma factor [Demequina sp. TTPB684]|uniref:RNA polymerase sigma factor n=1 Tax=unclassified Demequina TaxID=2620311 RepID=UPI001CF258AD|nr:MULTISPECIES: sigma-70 family RNA polymerase sigma factor [unclassified Demequina]MCB2412856.1 sigma-70 family RNA polymerase sigma factor [Demequina sp. TTPB684]UPU88167.1 sigma-70 family RNA polymerase sigma factor [Demequina sp. TMPB413]
MAPVPSVRERVAAFVEHEYGKVVAAVALATRDRDRAEDAVQDALVDALSAEQPPDNVAAWVTVVAINKVRMAHRRSGAQSRAYEKLPADSQDTADVAPQVVDAVTVHDAVATLPERQQQIVTLYYSLDTSVADIATSLDISTGTVKTQLHRARSSLAATLGKEAW